MFIPGSLWFVKLSGLVLKIWVYLGGPVAPNCTINKTKSSSSCLQLELVLFYYLRKGIAELSPQPMKILIDNGHGIQTKGKRSPDGKKRRRAHQDRRRGDRLHQEHRAKMLCRSIWNRHRGRLRRAYGYRQGVPAYCHQSRRTVRFGVY